LNKAGSTGRTVFSSSIEVTRAAISIEDGGRAIERSDHHSRPAPPGWQVLRMFAESLSTVLFPSSCRLCDSPLLRFSRLPVCDTCIDSIQAFDVIRCNVCGEAVNSFQNSEEEILCGMCHRARPHFLRAYAYGSYDGSLRGLIHLLKYQQIKPAAERLGRLLAIGVSASKESVSSRVLVVPVPLFSTKQHQRGFNQAELLSRAAIKHLNSWKASGFELHIGNLKRIRSTVSQTGLTSHQRRKNVRGAFALSKPQLVQGRSILLIDDVYTTGTTLNECTRVLRSVGAERVWVATVARVLRHHEGRVLSPQPMHAVDQGRERARIASSAMLGRV
jgi:ComF family protein